MSAGTKRPGPARFRGRVRYWARRIRVKPGRIAFGRLRAKWASCGPDGRLSFSEDLLDESLSVQDFVIVHELLHLRVPNHGALFRALLAAYQPDWRTAGGDRVTRLCSRRGPERPRG